MYFGKTAHSSVWYKWVSDNLPQSKSYRHKLRLYNFFNKKVKITLCLFYSERIRDLPVDVQCSVVESVGKQITAFRLRKVNC